MSGLKDRVKSLQTDTSNTDTALGTLEEALAEKVHPLTLPDHWSKVALMQPDSKSTDHPQADLTDMFEFIITVQLLSIYNLYWGKKA